MNTNWRFAYWTWIFVPACMLTSASGQVASQATSLPTLSTASQPATQPASTSPGSSSATAAAVNGKPRDLTEEWIQKTKNPTNWLSWGADFRAREEYADNVKSLNSHTPDHEVNFQRFRTRIWSTLKPTDDININSRLIWEFRSYVKPDNLQQYEEDEVLADILNVQWKNFLSLPTKLTVGRQEITDLGNNWLVYEGTPLDGSRTLFFNAARATTEFKPAKTTVDMIYLDQRANENSPRWLEPLNAVDNRYYTEQNERGAVVWLNNKSIKDTELGGYFIYKHDQKVIAKGDTGEIYTFGGRVAGQMDEHWRYNAEIAPQFGHKDGQEIKALGANTQLNYFTNDALNNNFRIFYEYLSGDDPHTKNTNESFDILWGRYARWSDIYGYTMIKETRYNQFTNLHRFGPGWSFSPLPKTDLATDYNLLFADQNTMAGKPGFSKNGPFRGQLLRTVLTYKFNDHIKSHIEGELFLPGNYYDSSMNDPAVYLRYEIVFSW